jgi:four helix bundle protein
MIWIDILDSPFDPVFVSDQLKCRTRSFALDVIALCAAIPNRFEARHIIQQVLRSSSSVAANFRAAFRGRSRAEFISKLGIVEEEADETHFWLELLRDSSERLGTRLTPDITNELGRLIDEAEQILRIIVASKKTAREREG